MQSLSTTTAHKAIERQLWDIEGFAEAHGPISTRHVYNLIARGDLEAVRVGRRTFVTDASRVRWLNGLPRKPPSQLNAAAQPAAA